MLLTVVSCCINQSVIKFCPGCLSTSQTWFSSKKMIIYITRVAMLAHIIALAETVQYA